MKQSTRILSNIVRRGSLLPACLILPSFSIIGELMQKEINAIGCAAIKCDGAYLPNEPLQKPATATITFYENGARDVGCIYLIYESSNNTLVCDAPHRDKHHANLCVHIYPFRSSENRDDVR
jgi:hypothetical protein